MLDTIDQTNNSYRLYLTPSNNSDDVRATIETNFSTYLNNKIWIIIFAFDGDRTLH